ncbi:glycosyltransferase family 1 protein [Dyadobacter sandarakinus]|uniref:Glycosyltransferase family 1 protein n=1 Tax=Dyadobacter sandarakinus TaxID=2747268 RepID=A0ABX7I2B7_9BACT|nr:glycosyltransferase family 1 protein [Dyadobacter sandarakinus]QRR00080.1 glycosyltransferase family 1 protein [Dyadobacter sandarakinus]
MAIKSTRDLLCFSHLRWDFVFQRPQHLMTRFAEVANVYFLEEPMFDSPDKAYLKFERKLPGLQVCVPHMPPGTSQTEMVVLMKALLKSFFDDRDVSNFTFWYYTPVAFEFSRSFTPDLIVYDCMDELSAFKFAPPQIKIMEQQLMAEADLVFTGGVSLYEAKKGSHHNIHPFPSSIDKTHFGAARKTMPEPADQASIPGIRLGFFGVIDERFDQELIREISSKRPDWHIVLIGPVVKIDPAALPKADNIHYLGCKNYQELPQYLAGWDVAMIPFMLNESTRFISPTKTPEYLAAGKPVVSTPIRDVVFPYGEMGLVSIGDDADTFIAAVEYELKNSERKEWLNDVDEYLSDKSWQDTFKSMNALMLSVKQKNPVVLTSELKSAS